MPPRKPRDHKKKGERPDAKKSTARGAAAGGPRRVVFPNVDTDGAKLPAPVAALQAVIHPPVAESAALVSSSSAPPSSLVEVEVETKQGYLLKGLLVELDAFYNVTIQDATSRRVRPCDIERELMRNKIEHTARAFNDPFFPGYRTGATAAPAALDEATAALLEEYRERPDSLARPRYVGTTMVRSSNLLMIRFLPSAAAVATTSTTTTTTAAPATAAGAKPPSASLLGMPLALRFSAMAAGVKRVLGLQKLQNRRERRQRLEEAKKKRNAS